MTIDLHLNAIQFTQYQYAAGYQTDRHDEIRLSHRQGQWTHFREATDSLNCWRDNKTKGTLRDIQDITVGDNRRKKKKKKDIILKTADSCQLAYSKSQKKSL